MSNISTLSPASTYPDLLQIANQGQGLNNTPVQLQDGLGNPTSITMSRNFINFNRSLGQLQLDGVALTASAATLNTLANNSGASYLLTTPNVSLPNAKVFTAGAGLAITQNAEKVIISPSSELAGIESLAAGPTGLVVNLGGGLYDTRTLITDATINMVDGDGVDGNPTFGVISDTCVQRIGVKLLGVDFGNKSNLNFIPGANMGISIFDNAPRNRMDITFSSLPASVFQYVATAEAASTGNLDATYDNGNDGVGATLVQNGLASAIELDGIKPPQGSIVLIKNQTNKAENGLYTVTDPGDNISFWELTRIASYDQPSEVKPATFAFVTEGDTQADTAWMEISTVTTIGTDPIEFISIPFTGTVTSVQGTPHQITVTNNTSVPVISIAEDYAGQDSITTVGTIDAGTWEGDKVEVPFGGTGNTSATPYSLITGGATGTAPLHSIGTGNYGEILFSLGNGDYPTWVNTQTVLGIVVSQVGHGFDVGDVIRCTGANTYALAQADSAINAEAIGIVNRVYDVNNFSFQYAGELVEVIDGLTAADVYFLSPSVAGGYTNVVPTDAGQVVKPLFVALSATTALWNPERGQVLGIPV